MSFIQAIRSRREAARSRREVQRVYGSAVSSGMRDELIVIAQRNLMERSR